MVLESREHNIAKLNNVSSIPNKVPPLRERRRIKVPWNSYLKECLEKGEMVLSHCCELSALELEPVCAVAPVADDVQGGTASEGE